MPTPERLPSYTPLSTGHTFPVRRRCHKCGEHKGMTGGKTFPGGKRWHCKDCR